ncbi:hypothetical protein PC118_g19080 [Phytophthora cactorum]|uniref:Uncharacterized protein n=1 Tax=Phytophthora cactorum TaxID=29920 RepID=A0A8T0YEU8_9STRA|nr:hypothetical protein PC111_g19476 [Phytophthora cactorum]KAG2802579.1 hypothetical protein PC112_g19568 [Phytophthora cactorum]KAG2839553.1 hypothetical protein PC113_g19446 [Phytophthora cactorum]KAG2966591.1 hypothetical protein PC118_g19080 [Phytophthora cactorum]KAG3169947.1 hypothetical protein PC128_g19022 [Phytophthora cactorum]
MSRNGYAKADPKPALEQSPPSRQISHWLFDELDKEEEEFAKLEADFEPLDDCAEDMATRSASSSTRFDRTPRRTLDRVLLSLNWIQRGTSVSLKEESVQECDGYRGKQSRIKFICRKKP